MLFYFRNTVMTTWTSRKCFRRWSCCCTKVRTEEIDNTWSCFWQLEMSIHQVHKNSSRRFFPYYNFSMQCREVHWLFVQYMQWNGSLTAIMLKLAPGGAGWRIVCTVWWQLSHLIPRVGVYYVLMYERLNVQ